MSRHADVYVFALLKHQERDTLDPLNVAQWEFYVLPTRTLNERTRSQHSITLPSLQKISGGALTFEQLRSAVTFAAKK